MVQFYDEASFPARSLAEFLWTGIQLSGGASLILTAEHLRAVTSAMRKLGLDPARLTREGRLLLLDADDTLSRFIRGGIPDARRFRAAVGQRIDQVVSSGGTTHAVGEMVGRLVTGGNVAGALALERLWSTYIARRRITLRCLYPIALFADPSFTRTFHRIMGAHQHVVPVLDAAAEPGDTHAWIARLQQRTRALEAEVTRRRAAELAATASRRQLRALGRYLVEAGEADRAAVSRRIHDELGQPLAALRMDMDRLRRRLKVDDEDPQQRLLEMMAIVEHLASRVQGIAQELRPAMLDDLGLPATIQWVARDFQERTGITCTARIPARESPLDRDRTTAVYRVLQESLANVSRHARAAMVEIVLAQSAAALDLVVRDDGVGISRRQAQGPASLGLTGMRERAQSIGGTLKVSGSPGRGTTVRLHVPLAAARQAG